MRTEYVFLVSAENSGVVLENVFELTNGAWDSSSDDPEAIFRVDRDHSVSFFMATGFDPVTGLRDRVLFPASIGGKTFGENGYPYGQVVEVLNDDGSVKYTATVTATGEITITNVSATIEELRNIDYQFEDASYYDSQNQVHYVMAETVTEEVNGVQTTQVQDHLISSLQEGQQFSASIGGGEWQTLTEAAPLVIEGGGSFELRGSEVWYTPLEDAGGSGPARLAIEITQNGAAVDRFELQAEAVASSGTGAGGAQDGGAGQYAFNVQSAAAAMAAAHDGGAHDDSSLLRLLPVEADGFVDSDGAVLSVEPTHVAVQSGNWNDLIWDTDGDGVADARGDAMPDGALVHIPHMSGGAEIEVTATGAVANGAHLFIVRVDGVLNIEATGNTATAMTVDTLFSSRSGSLNIDASDVDQGNVSIAVTGYDIEADANLPAYYSDGAINRVEFTKLPFGKDPNDISSAPAGNRLSEEALLVTEKATGDKFVVAFRMVEDAEVTSDGDFVDIAATGQSVELKYYSVAELQAGTATFDAGFKSLNNRYTTEVGARDFLADLVVDAVFADGTTGPYTVAFDDGTGVLGRFAWDPEQLSLGVVAAGQTRISGDKKIEHIKSGIDIAAGSTSIELVLDDATAANLNWKIGDQLLITATRRGDEDEVNTDLARAVTNEVGTTLYEYISKDETATISNLALSVNAAGEQVVTISFEAPLQNDHMTKTVNGTVLSANIANLSRSVTIVSTDALGSDGTVVDATASSQLGFDNTAGNHDHYVTERGHIMFMHNDDVIMSNASVIGMGRTDKSVTVDEIRTLDDEGILVDSNGNDQFDRGTDSYLANEADQIVNHRGRYAVHIHQAGTEDPGSFAELSGNVVMNAVGWGYAQHGSNANLYNNIAFDVTGAAFVAETGNESGEWTGNLSAYNAGLGELIYVGNPSISEEGRWGVRYGTDAGGGGLSGSRFDFGGGFDGPGVRNGAAHGDHGQNGHGYWFDGRNIDVVGNISTGAAGNAYVFTTFGNHQVNTSAENIAGRDAANISNGDLSDVTHGAETIWNRDMPIRGFEGNEAVAASIGVFIVTDQVMTSRRMNDAYSHLSDFTSWESLEAGVHTDYAGKYIFDNFLLDANTVPDIRSSIINSAKYGNAFLLETAAADMIVVNSYVNNFKRIVRLEGDVNNSNRDIANFLSPEDAVTESGGRQVLFKESYATVDELGEINLQTIFDDLDSYRSEISNLVNVHVVNTEGAVLRSLYAQPPNYYGNDSQGLKLQLGSSVDETAIAETVEVELIDDSAIGGLAALWNETNDDAAALSYRPATHDGKVQWLDTGLASGDEFYHLRYQVVRDLDGEGRWDLGFGRAGGPNASGRFTPLEDRSDITSGTILEFKKTDTLGEHYFAYSDWDPITKTNTGGRVEVTTNERVIFTEEQINATLAANGYHIMPGVTYIDETGQQRDQKFVVMKTLFTDRYTGELFGKSIVVALDEKWGDLGQGAAEFAFAGIINDGDLASGNEFIVSDRYGHFRNGELQDSNGDGVANHLDVSTPAAGSHYFSAGTDGVDLTHIAEEGHRAAVVLEMTGGADTVAGASEDQQLRLGAGQYSIAELVDAPPAGYSVERQGDDLLVSDSSGNSILFSGLGQVGLVLPDGVVTGTDERNIINVGYVDTADGDVVDDSGNVINVGGGYDNVVNDGAGNDTVYGNEHRDFFHAGAGSDAFFGGDGEDYVLYGRSDVGVTIDLTDPSQSTGIAHGDTFDSIERLVGSDHDDVIIGAGNVQIYGGAGDDLIVDSETSARVTGSAGADVFRFILDGQVDRIMDFKPFEDGDRIDLSLWGVTDISQLTITEEFNNGSWRNRADLYFDPGNGAMERIHLDGIDRFEIEQLTNDNFILAGPQSDGIVSGTARQNALSVGYVDATDGDVMDDSGNVIDVVGGSNNAVFDGAGNDTVYGAEYRDFFYAGDGADVYYGEEGFDYVLYGRSEVGMTIDMRDTSQSTGFARGDVYDNIERIRGSDHDDVIIGAGDIQIDAAGGDDIIQDGETSARLSGDDGADVFRFILDGQVDRILDFDPFGEGDRIDLSLWGVTDLSEVSITERSNNGVWSNVSDLVYDPGNGAVESISLDGIDRFEIAQLTNDNFILAGPQSDGIVSGTARQNALSVGYVDATDGDVMDDSGNVIDVVGGSNNAVFDGAGNDTVYGAEYRDFFYAGDGADVYYGEEGFDYVLYGRSEVGMTIDMRDTSQSTGFARGDVYDNIERIRGSDHDDVIIGAGDIQIDAAGGDDIIQDGETSARLSGDDGADVFRFILDGQVDRILDFDPFGEGDRIDLSLWGVTDLSQVSITERSNNGVWSNVSDLVYDPGNGAVESISLDGIDRFEIAQLTDDNFIFA